MRTWLITGGEGFIGYHICKEITDRSLGPIVTLDSHNHYIDLEDSKWPFYQRYRSNKLDEIGVDRYIGDVNNRGLLKEILEEYRPTNIIHLAALPIANVSNKYPYEARKNILDTTLTLMDTLRDVNFDFDRVIYTSSSMVYGDFDKIPAGEDDNYSPLGMYGAMKLAGEHIVRAYGNRFDMPYTIIRPSAVYGPTDCNRRVTEIFIRRAMNGETLFLDNGGQHELDFTYVKDTATGFVLAATDENGEGRTFNITRGEGRSIEELSEVIGDVVDKEVSSSPRERDVYRPNRGALDISQAQKLLGYEPEYSLEQGMKEYYEFIQETEEW